MKGKAEAEQEFEQRQQAGENVGLVESRYTQLLKGPLPIIICCKFFISYQQGYKFVPDSY